MRNLFRHRLFRLVTIIVSLILVVNLSQSVYTLWRKTDIIRQREQALRRVEAENQRLKQVLERAQSSTFVEQQAREKLGLAREGEAIVLLPSPRSASEATQLSEGTTNWRRWWKLFF